MIVVAHQHLLPSIVPFLEKVASHLESPSQLYLLGKPYSTVPEVEQQLGKLGMRVVPTNNYAGVPGEYRSGINDLLARLWEDVNRSMADTASEELILIDEGGWLISSIPDHLKVFVVSCIEQTSSGIRNHPTDVPMISVAESAAKRYFESPFIANAIVKKMQSQGWIWDGVRIGIVGHGFLGSALSAQLGNMGFEVRSYDPKANESGISAHGIKELIAGSDLILGCTGQDVLDPNVDLSGLAGDKVFASCSSGDVEFNRLIHMVRRYGADYGEAFSNIEGYANDGQLMVSILNGGCPINFDRVTEWEERGDIQLTRNLMLSALSQTLSISEFPGSIMLDPEKQMEITREWLRTSRQERSLDIAHSQQIWWAEHSGGRLPANYSVEISHD